VTTFESLNARWSILPYINGWPLLAELRRSCDGLTSTYSVEKLAFSLPTNFRRLTNDTDNWLDGGN